MNKVKTYDLEDCGSAYMVYREMVEQMEYEGDWVTIEDYQDLRVNIIKFLTGLYIYEGNRGSVIAIREYIEQLKEMI
tara:strand:+ start:980 stop:1210 length:231 start_codon:yes stop_codon:yes gene_type:complete